MKHYPSDLSRSGTILIIVSGIAGLLASVAIAFLARIRNDVDDMSAVVRETQARIMLAAACNYIQEASRIGYDPRPDSGVNNIVEHLEAHGWIDVRDGSMGPRINSLPDNYNGNDTAIETSLSQRQKDLNDRVRSNRVRPFKDSTARAASPSYPYGSKVLWCDVPQRFPMYRMRRPPYAIQLKNNYNPINSSDSAKADYLVPYLKYPDPQPVVSNHWNKDSDPSGSTVVADNWTSYEQGDMTPVNESVGLSWFRIFREDTGSVFTVTCGAGGTWGFRNFGEAQKEGKADFFDNNIKVFESLRNAEAITWYRVEWSPAISGADVATYSSWPLNNGNPQSTHEYDFTKLISVNAYELNLSRFEFSSTSCVANYGGTISWIQRLRSEPKDW